MAYLQMPPSQPHEATLPSGIDKEEVLARLNGNHKVLQQLLIRFRRDFSVIAEQLAASVQQQDCKQIQFLAHRIAGVAGNLSMTQLHQLAKSVEGDTPTEDNQKLPKQVSHLIQTLQDTLKDVEQLYPSEQQDDDHG